MTFFDITPSGRIVNRFSRDAFSVDDPLPFHLNVLLAQVRKALIAFLFQENSDAETFGKCHERRC